MENFPQVESGRVAIGEAVEAELKAMGERRGRPKQEGEGQGELVEDDIREIFPEFIGKRTDEIAADKAGFGNRKTYQQAKAVAHHAAVCRGSERQNSRLLLLS